MTSLWWRGHPVWVSTVYLGVNHQWQRGLPPLIWETMVTSHFEFSDWQMRYCTRTAAQIAHQQIIDALLASGLVLADPHADESEFY